MVHELEENEDLMSKIKEGNYLVDFTASWCGPCKLLSPVLKTINGNVIKVNVDKHAKLSSQFKVSVIPTLVYCKNGKEIDRTTGFQTKENIQLKLDNM